jgi:hypothetical protein
MLGSVPLVIGQENAPAPDVVPTVATPRRMLVNASRTDRLDGLIGQPMNKQAPATGFSASERDYIRRELDMFFSTLPTVAEGFQLKTWRGGPQAGRPKVPPVARSLMDVG